MRLCATADATTGRQIAQRGEPPQRTASSAREKICDLLS